MPAGGSKPGERRGGREKGTPNKGRQEFLALLDEACKTHDVQLVAMVVAEVANQENKPEVRLQAAKLLMDHAFPKPKAIEHSGQVDMGAAFLEALKRA